MNTQYYDARRPLVVSIALLALYGLEQERTTLARMRSGTPYVEDPGVLEVRRVVKDLKTWGGVVHTSDTEVLDRMAYARQLAKIPLDEWEVVVRVERSLQIPVSDL
jgi:hypothetical protein